MTRRHAPPARGVLQRAAPHGEFEHVRLLPRHSALVDVVAHFWSVQWRLRAPFSAETLPHPTAHIVFESRADATLVGPGSKRFTRTLVDGGWVFGVKFRPAMIAALWRASSIRALADRVVPLTALSAAAASSWQRETAIARTCEERARIAEERLLRLSPSVDAELLVLRDLVERTERDRLILRVEQLAKAAHMTTRTLERRFSRCVGKSPKWVIRRYRLIDAAERLHEPNVRVIDLAHELGYFDQAHFARDFKALVGVAPTTYRRRTPGKRGTEAWSPRTRTTS